MKKILLIATGGTIASGNTPSGLTPTISGEELLKSVPGLKNICEPHAIQVLNLDSTDMTPADWLVISGAIERYYDEYDGFVVAHGTDTMAYTAAALSYLVRRSPKPIVLTGAQKPIHSENTDSQVNLLDAFAYACSPGSPSPASTIRSSLPCGRAGCSGISTSTIGSRLCSATSWTTAWVS